MIWYWCKLITIFRNTVHIIDKKKTTTESHGPLKWLFILDINFKYFSNLNIFIFYVFTKISKSCTLVIWLLYVIITQKYEINFLIYFKFLKLLEWRFSFFCIVQKRVNNQHKYTSTLLQATKRLGDSRLDSTININSFHLSSLLYTHLQQ